MECLSFIPSSFMLKPSIHAGFGIFGLCNWRCRSDMQTLKNYRIKRRKTAFEPSCLFFLKENEHRYCKYDKIWFPLNCINPCAFRHDWVTKKMSPNFFQYSCGFAGFLEQNPKNGFTVDVQTANRSKIRHSGAFA